MMSFEVELDGSPIIVFRDSVLPGKSAKGNNTLKSPYKSKHTTEVPKDAMQTLGTIRRQSDITGFTSCSYEDHRHHSTASLVP